jgi:hypothetical protein
MNWNKLTKAELISKFKKLESKNSSNNSTNRSLFNRIIELIIAFKSLLIKLTLISLLIKLLKKYTFIGKILRFINWIIVSIFGISLIDNFGIEFITNFYKEIRVITYSIINYLSDTSFYSFIASLFSTKDKVTNQAKISLRDGPLMEESSYETSRKEKSINKSKGNSKISEWLNPEPELSINSEESNNKKYYIIAGMLILSCLAWYYFDDIKPVGISWVEWIRSFRSSNGGDPNGTSNNVQPNNQMNLKSRLKDLFNKKDKTSDLSTQFDNSSQATITQIELEDKTPRASTSNILTRNNSDESIDIYFPKNKGKAVQFADNDPINDRATIIPQYTGMSSISQENFPEVSSAILGEIDQFNKEVATDNFPNLAIRVGLYNLIRKRLDILKQTDKFSYDNFLDTDYIRNKISTFIGLENQSWYSDLQEEKHETYQDVVQATEQEQETWSDKSSSPKVKSPIKSIDQLLSPEQSPGMSTYAIDDQQMQDYRRELSPIQEPISTFTSILEEVRAPKNNITSESEPSNSELLKTVETADTNIIRKTRSNLFDMINARRKESDVIDSAKRYEAENTKNVQIIGEDQTQPEVVHSKLSPLIDNTEFRKFATKSSKIDLVESNPELKVIDLKGKSKEVLPDITIDSSSSSDSSKEHYFPKTEINTEEVQSGFNTLIDKIGTNVTNSPNINQLGLHPTVGPSKLSPLLQSKPSLSNLFDDTMNLFDDEVDITPTIDKGKDDFIEKVNFDHQLRRKTSLLGGDFSPITDWNSVNVDMLERGDKRSFRIYFGDSWRSTQQIIIRTNDNYLAIKDFDPTMVPDWNNDLPKIITFDWGHEIAKLDNLGYKTEIHDIQLKDMNGNLHQIYFKDNFHK